MKEVSKKDLRKFGMVLGVILSVFGAIHLMKNHTNIYKWFFAPAAVSFFLAIFLPEALKPIFTVFTKVAHAMGWVNTRVILVLVYYVILTPIGLVMKFFGKDILNLKINKNEETYWIARKEKAIEKESLIRQF